MDLTRWGWAGLGVAMTLAVGAPVQAAPYTAEYVFGDSLSDNGNAAEFLGQAFPNPPSFHDSFTNGPVASQLLAGALGLPLNPSLWLTGFQDASGLFGGTSAVPGTNYAVATATAASGSATLAPNLPQQLMAYGLRSGGVADPSALYVVEIGGNDVRNAALQGTGATAVITGVATEVTAIKTLVAAGAKNLLVVNVPNVGMTPEFAQDNVTLVATATAYSQLYDFQLNAGLSGLALPTGTSLTQFDLYSFNTGLIANAAALGFTDTTDRCFTNTPLSPAATAQCGTNGANISQFVYWDAIHPTARVQALWATGFETALGVAPQVASVPEPGSLAVLGFGVAGMIGLGRRRVTAAR